jgi:hypothetical protein
VKPLLLRTWRPELRAIHNHLEIRMNYGCSSSVIMRALRTRHTYLQRFASSMSTPRGSLRPRQNSMTSSMYSLSCCSSYWNVLIPTIGASPSSSRLMSAEGSACSTCDSVVSGSPFDDSRIRHYLRFLKEYGSDDSSSIVPSSPCAAGGDSGRGIIRRFKCCTPA